MKASDSTSLITLDTPSKNDLILKKYERFKMSAAKPILSPPPTISINGFPMLTEGNIGVIAGPPKSGKSSLTCVTISEAIKPVGGNCDGFVGYEVKENINGKAVLHFDLEQAPHHQHKSFKNAILKRANLKNEPDYCLSYNIKVLDIKQSKKACSEISEAAYNNFGGIHMIIIDGAADLIKSVNDETEANDIVRFFEHLAVLYRTVVIVIVHFNPNSEKHRGHLGSQLQRKAEAIFNVKKNGSVSSIETQFLRVAESSDLPQIQFQFDKNKGYHVSCGLLVKPSGEDILFKQLSEWAFQVFSDTPISNKDAITKLMVVTGLAERQLNTKIKDMVMLKILTKKGRSYTLYKEQTLLPELETKQ